MIPKNISNSKLKHFCLKHHIKRMSLFGSSIRGGFHPDSDIDLLVEFEEPYVPGLFELSEMEDELSTYFEGRKVDIRTPNDLSKYFRQEVLSTTETLYARS